LSTARPNGQLEPAPVERQDHLLRRWPRPGPIRGRHGYPEAMAGRKGMRADVERHPHLVPCARLERAKVCMTLPVGEVEEAAGDQRRRAVGEDVAEAHADKCLRTVDLDVDDDFG